MQTHLVKTNGKIVFVGHFWDYFFKSLALLLLTIITAGLLLPYFVWWHLKYFFDHMEIELYE